MQISAEIIKCFSNAEMYLTVNSIISCDKKLVYNTSCSLIQHNFSALAALTFGVDALLLWGCFCPSLGSYAASWPLAIKYQQHPRLPQFFTTEVVSRHCQVSPGSKTNSGQKMLFQQKILCVKFECKYINLNK